jgi:hypothetical protein
MQETLYLSYCGMVTAHAWYSEGPEFEFRLENILFQLEIFMLFLNTFSELSVQQLKLGHCWFFYNSSEWIFLSHQL